MRLNRRLNQFFLGSGFKTSSFFVVFSSGSNDFLSFSSCFWYSNSCLSFSCSSFCASTTCSKAFSYLSLLIINSSCFFIKSLFKRAFSSLSSSSSFLTSGLISVCFACFWLFWCSVVPSSMFIATSSRYLTPFSTCICYPSSFWFLLIFWCTL